MLMGWAGLDGVRVRPGQTEVRLAGRGGLIGWVSVLAGSRRFYTNWGFAGDGVSTERIDGSEVPVIPSESVTDPRTATAGHGRARQARTDRTDRMDRMDGAALAAHGRFSTECSVCCRCYPPSEFYVERLGQMGLDAHSRGGVHREQERGVLGG